MGFSVPIVEWFSDELKHFLDHYFDPIMLERQGLFDVASLLRLKTDYLSGNINNVNKLWLVLMFQMWYEKWMN